jgi:signal transduction histidine kinase
MRYYKSFKLIRRVIPYPDIRSSQSFVDWQNRLLFVLMAGLVIMGFIACIPSVFLSLKEGLWMVALIDTLVYLTVLYVAFSKKLSSQAKVKIILITFYVLGIAILILMGQAGAGYNWLFFFPLLSGFFYGIRGVFFSTTVNIISLSLLTIPVYFKTEGIGLISEYSTAGWIVNSINFIVVTSLISLALTVIITNIDKSLKKEKRMIHLLRENRNKLEEGENQGRRIRPAEICFFSQYEPRNPYAHECRSRVLRIDCREEFTEPQKFRHYNSLIKMSGEQLIRIIDDIIDISKIEMNQMSIDIQPMPYIQG